MSSVCKASSDYVNGWLIIDKPKGLSSARVVGRIKHLLGGVKVGHAGPLDPLATGVLAIALGEATKTVSYVLNGNKDYNFTLKWGEARNTDDAEGKIIKTCSKRPTSSEITNIIEKFIGEVWQIPPAFSALKVSGQRAYTLARSDVDFCLPPRLVQIQNLKLLQSDRNTATLYVRCSKGTYIRALARDLGECLGTVSHIIELRRTIAGPFDVNVAISLDKLETLVHSARLAAYVQPVEAPLADIPALELDESDAKRLSHGQTISGFNTDIPTVRVKSGKRLIALAKIYMGELCPVRVFNL